MYKTYDDFKASLGGNILHFLEKYEGSIRDFIRRIVYDKLINSYTKDQVERMVKYKFMIYGAILLSENAGNLSIALEKDTEGKILSQIKEWGLDTDEVGHQLASAIFNAYVASTEDIRKHLMLFVDFEIIQEKLNKLQGRDIRKLTFSEVIGCLHDIYPDNDFIRYLYDTHIVLRNLMAHYNYTWESKELCLYEGVFDEEPKRKYRLEEFLQEVLNLYTLSTALFYIYKKLIIDPI
ncbi:MAG TPA: hypothetical protein ENI52_01415 [Thermoplasmata archaeon]|nr:hypothetical protein [Thermoplasmata archaeon]